MSEKLGPTTPLPYRLEPLSAEQIQQQAARRTDARQGVHLMIPEDTRDMAEVGERLVTAERSLASPSLLREDYRAGTALWPDHIHTAKGTSGLIISSEHATVHHRTLQRNTHRTDRSAETGTAALGAVVAGEMGGTHISLLGRQTGDANHDAAHRYKDHLTGLLGALSTGVFLSVHGMARHVEHFDDERPFDILVGVGDKPGLPTQRLAESVVSAAKTYGLRAAINQQLIIVDEIGGMHYTRIDRQDGTRWSRSFSASNPRTTRSTAERYACEQGIDLAALQVEVAPHLRLFPIGEARSSRKVREAGPYLAYLTLVTALDQY